jgi:hypothetical protein
VGSAKAALSQVIQGILDDLEDDNQEDVAARESGGAEQKCAMTTGDGSEEMEIDSSICD